MAELADALASGSVTTVDLSACRFPVHISCGAVCEKPTSVLDLSRVRSFKFLYADVAELADALASGSVTTVDLSACRFPVHISCGAVCEKPTSVLDLSRVRSFKFLYADVAELADALASGASDRKVMWVQVPSSAP